MIDAQAVELIKVLGKLKPASAPVSEPHQVLPG
jgi:hypothetical protein